jgi:hypothetical protein
LSFCLFRFTLEFRLDNINQHLLSKLEANNDNIDKVQGGNSNVRKTVSKFTRPSHLKITKEMNQTGLQIPLRVLE